ncbi:MAG: PLP-dependent transferase [Alphaproteobacteria bacterium]|nr:PLP-dependent transferase [Alphaproteobacteria bacterium]
MPQCNERLRPETIAAKAASHIDAATGGLVPPIQPSTTYARDDAYRLLNPDHIYGRDDLPIYRIVENVIAALDGAAAALVLPSGMAAIAALFRTVPDGGAVAVQRNIYFGTTQWVRAHCGRHGITFAEFDGTDAGHVATVVDQARPDLVLIETPSNPWLEIVDVARAAEAAHRIGAQLVVDSTAATPVLSRPLEWGADYIVHSATKALNGHSDVFAGAIAAAAEDDRWAAIKADRRETGALLGPFEAWLLVRGLRTLAVRVERASANAQAIADFLASHRRVGAVHYPGLPGHPNHDVAKRQMTGGFGYLLSFQIDGDGPATVAVANNLRTIVRATSLGGVETMIEHRHTIEGDVSDMPENLLRLSVGIEHVDDLIDDLRQALDGPVG